VKPPLADVSPYTGLTPNHDGVNDYWIIKNIESYPDNEVLIFNLWGTKIASFRNYDNKNVVWDGTYSNGEVVIDGTYYYIMNVKNLGSKTGWIYVRHSHD
jgi:large repetitive protein